MQQPSETLAKDHWALRSSIGGAAASWAPPVILGMVLGYGIARDLELHPLWGVAAGLGFNALVGGLVWWRAGSLPLAPFRVGGGRGQLFVNPDEVRLVPSVGDAFVISLHRLELVSGRTFVELCDREDGRVRELAHPLFEAGKPGAEAFVSAVRAAFASIGDPQTTQGRHRRIGAVTYSMRVDER